MVTDDPKDEQWVETRERDEDSVLEKGREQLIIRSELLLDEL